MKKILILGGSGNLGRPLARLLLENRPDIELTLAARNRVKLEKIVEEVHYLGGLSIASHIDRPSYSIPSQLGFIPPDLDLDAIEISKPQDKDAVLPLLLGESKLPVLTASDAHYSKDIGRNHTKFFLETPSFDELRMALRLESGRTIEEISG